MWRVPTPTGSTWERHAWRYAGTAGADFAVTDHDLYGLKVQKTGVLEWDSAKDMWVDVGGPALELYAGPQGLYATNVQDATLWHYSGTPGQWTQVSDVGADFATRGTALLRLARDRSAIWMRDSPTAPWRRISGPAQTLATIG
ncbi:hypothetical protein E2C00_01090 [Streptomyces sp. WAC05374]|uniref:hypothetical protein n=1 Tax=Streptomyces sp. WAC05374 TaxID=2487420 RepID=UPI000F874CA7|nr:hypothetical protein [Streptomyces sp. WAC05374]RST16377.1 hypothetical protein EF905_12580 [Streptomyces sp. WAC05374]TDF50141.1 hypothetical protein E2B92_01065 [Streptomyces sp. WAC05374]TDF57866.1 hypothetical protein E2C02_08855 [Streptomyces sp. WAC05374]TDF60395.1 hypothetical protein E2C00_01090 [Streptomyces sp. WAC05374]